MTTNKTLKNYLLENSEELKEIVRELNSWNGSLDHLDVYENDEEFFNMMFEGKAMEAVRAAHYGDYNYNHDLVKFDGYGNLESLTYRDYEEELKDSIDEIIEALEENKHNISLSDELEELLNEEEPEPEINLYKELRDKHQKEVNDFKMAFAFDNKQFDEGMKKLGLEPDQTDKVLSLGMGGFILKTDKEKYFNMFKKQEEEMKQAINDIETGEQFIFDMFNYELANHEYTYTYEIEPTLDALGLTFEEVQNNEKLLKGLKAAKLYQQENDSNNY